jgi:hypothetical protein
MGFLSKIFAKPSRADGEMTATVEVPACPHVALVPRWDSIDDIGHEDRATHFVCEACGESFSPEDARRLRESEAQRLSSITSQN